MRIAWETVLILSSPLIVGSFWAASCCGFSEPLGEADKYDLGWVDSTLLASLFSSIKQENWN